MNFFSVITNKLDEKRISFSTSYKKNSSFVTPTKNAVSRQELKFRPELLNNEESRVNYCQGTICPRELENPI